MAWRARGSAHLMSSRDVLVPTCAPLLLLLLLLLLRVSAAGAAAEPQQAAGPGGGGVGGGNLQERMSQRLLQAAGAEPSAAGATGLDGQQQQQQPPPPQLQTAAAAWTHACRINLISTSRFEGPSCEQQGSVGDATGPPPPQQQPSSAVTVLVGATLRAALISAAAAAAGAGAAATPAARLQLHTDLGRLAAAGTSSGGNETAAATATTATAAAVDWGVTFVCPPPGSSSNTSSSLLLHDSVVADLPLSPVGALVTFVNCSRVGIINSAFVRLTGPSAAAADSASSASSASSATPPPASVHGAVMVAGSRTQSLLWQGTTCSQVRGASGYACLLAASLLAPNASVVVQDSSFANNSVESGLKLLLPPQPTAAAAATAATSAAAAASAAASYASSRAVCNATWTLPENDTQQGSVTGGGYGAMVLNAATVTVANSRFLANSAACGAAIALVGREAPRRQLALTAGSRLEGNTAVLGAALFSSAEAAAPASSSDIFGSSSSSAPIISISMAGSSAAGNVAAVHGGLFFAAAPTRLALALARSNLTGNSATGGCGGAVYLPGGANLLAAGSTLASF